jgi:NRPS condensation-like uncharacterized protein
MNSHLQRELSLSERFYWLSNQESPFNICIAVGIEGDLDPLILREALDILQKRYVFLRSSVRNPSKPYFTTEEVGHIPLRVHRLEEEDQWVGEIDNELHTPFSYESGPLMRVAYLKGFEKSELLVSTDHLITDGLACIHLIEELLQIVDGLNQQSPILSHPSSIIQQPLEFFIPESINFSTTSSPVLSVDNASAHTVPGRMGDPEGTGLLFSSLSQEETSRLMVACRDNGTTVQGALFAAMILVMQRETQLQKIAYECPANLRGFLQPALPLTELGSHIGILYFEAHFEREKGFWDLAREAKSQLHAHLNEDLVRKTIEGIERIMPDCNSYGALKEAKKWSKPLVGVSNLGRINLRSEYGSFKVGSVRPCVSLHGNFYNEHNLYMTACTFKSSIYFSFLFPKALMLSDKAKTITDSVVDLLKSF